LVIHLPSWASMGGLTSECRTAGHRNGKSAPRSTGVYGADF
jgi:hypothetical protein